MTSRERVLAAIRHQMPDRVPMDFGGTAMSQANPEFLRQMRLALGLKLPSDRDDGGSWVDEAIQMYLGTDLRFVPLNPPLAVLKDIDPAAYLKALEAKERSQAAPKDIKTTAVKHDFYLAGKSYDEIKAIAPNPPPPPKYLDWIISRAKSCRESGYATTFWVSSGFFEIGCAMRGYDQFAMDLLCETDIVKAIFDRLLVEKLSQIESIIKPLANYIDIFCFGDDFGMQNAPFMSPQTFDEIIKPYFDQHYGAVHKAAPESFLFHHSCGSVYRLLDSMIDMGVDILNPIQPLAAEMEPERLKAKGGRLCFHGGIDLQELLPFGRPEEVRSEVERQKHVLGEGGGYICAPAHALPDDVPVENILAMFDKL